MKVEKTLKQAATTFKTKVTTMIAQK